MNTAQTVRASARPIPGRGARRSLPSRPRARQLGQAVIWLLGTLAASAAVMYAVFNVSQVTVGKQRAVNAADAAALAGSTVQARLLNLMAYNNRAIVANEVFLIQMLSIESWMQYFVRTAENIETVLDIASLIPPVAPFAKPAAQILDKLGDVAEKGHDAIVDFNDLIISLLEPAKTALLTAHAAVRLAGGVLAENAAKSTVVANRSDFGGKRHDPGLILADTAAVRPLTFVANQQRWLSFTKKYENNERTDAKQVLLDSRDRFSAHRPGAGWLNFSLLLVGLEKGGGSALKNFDRWETQDTLELWQKAPPKFKKNYVPVGWGRANADENGSTGDTWSPNRTAHKWARSDGTTHDGWSGVPAVFDIADKTIAKRADLSVGFLVAVSRPGTHDMLSQSLGMGVATTSVAGSPDMPARQAANQNTAFSKAHVFFERPRRGLANDFTASSLWRPDQAKEFGSIFSPYWQARLTDLSAGEKAALMTAMGLTPDHAIYTPGGQK